MVLTACEMVWLKQQLSEVKFGEIGRMKLIRDKLTILHIAFNSQFHERTKHIEIDCYFIKKKILS